ncbi:MAG: T9SS type A sorting domain-containing protein [Bacteroidota bacterium]
MEISYVASSSECLKIFDVTNPLYPSIIKLTVFVGGAEDVVVFDNYAYVTNGDYWDENKWQGSQVRVFNISDPMNPLEIGLYKSPGNVSQLSKSGNTLIISEGTTSYSSSGEDGSGLRFLNIVDPSQPQPINFYPTPGLCESVVVRGNYAFVLTKLGGISVIDLQNISEPIQIGYYNSPGSPKQVVLQNNYAYLADGEGGLRVIDISDLSSPVETGSLEMNEFVIKVAVKGDYAYVISDQDRLHVLNISDPSNIFEVNAMIVNYTPSSVLIDGNLLYLSEASVIHWGAWGWITIFDITDPINIFQIGEYYSEDGLNQSGFHPTDIALQGSYLYVANLGSLRIFDVSDPTNPVVISDTPTFVEDIEVEGKFAYLAFSDGYLKIFDVSNPFGPKEISLFESQFYITDIDVKDGKIYASTFDHGMIILRNDLATDREEDETIPPEYTLKQNYPNPFNPSTTIEYSIPTSPLNPSPYQGEGHRERLVILKVYDILGSEVATLVNEYQRPGNYSVEFNVETFHGTSLPSGVYFYKLQSGNFIQTRKMILLK